jgi:hypothetical protein
MNQPPSTDQISTCLIGPLYALLYWTIKNKFLEFTIAGWLKNLSFFLAVIALLFSWGLAIFILCLGLTIALRILYWIAKRDGYIRFKPTGEIRANSEGKQIVADKKVQLNATGKFSVKNLESYVVRQQAEYWRVPMGDHAVMVKQGTGRYLYQFIKADMLESVVAGTLCHGRQPESALEITYLATWGPETEDVSFMFYAPGKSSSSKKKRRKLYLGFNDESLMHDVWYSLTIDGQVTKNE